MAQITALTPAEHAHVDRARVAAIMAELGEAAAQQVICMALEQLAAILAAVEKALAAGDRAQAVADAERMSRLAWQIGLVSLAGVAMDLGGAAERGDHAALSAIRQRLRRVGNQSLTAIWDRAVLP